MVKPVAYNGCIELDVKKVIEIQAASMEEAKLSKNGVAQLHAIWIVCSSGRSIQVYNLLEEGGMFEGWKPHFFDKLFLILPLLHDSFLFTPQGRLGLEASSSKGMFFHLVAPPEETQSYK